MSKRLTTKSFTEKAKEIHKDKYDYSLVKYKNYRTKVKIICKEHGEFEQRPSHHLKGQNCPFCGKLNSIKKQIFSKETLLKKLFNTEYNIVGEYGGMKHYILIEDNYGICKVKPKQLVEGRVPSIKSAVNKNAYFSNKSKEIHDDKYDYSKVDYKDSRVKVKIICPEHGLFEQTPNKHLLGQGCRKCSQNTAGWTTESWIKLSEKSKNFDSFKVYIIKCWNDEEEFYKIGKTFKTVEKRFDSNKDMPYNYEILKIFKRGAKEISKLEKQLQKDNKNFKYIPKIKFNGMYECFKKIKL